MKKLLTLTIVLALVAPAMAAETRIWANNGNQLYVNNPDSSYTQLASRTDWRWSLVKFDDLTSTLTTAGVDSNDITSAMLRMRCNYIVDMSGSAEWQPIGDTDAYVRINPMLHDWGANTHATLNHSDADASIQWLGQDGSPGAWDPYRTEMGNYDYGASVADTIMPLARPFVGWPDPPAGDPLMDDRYNFEIDITDLVKDWVNGVVTNYGIYIGLYTWLDPVLTSTWHGTNQVNFTGNDPYGEPNEGQWYGPPVISVYDTGPVDPPPPHAGDVDSDGDVDIFDFMDLQGNFGTTSGAVWAEGDIDPYDGNSSANTGDGDVDIFDFMDIQANWGWDEGGGVPEPATISLLTLGGLALIRRRKK